MKPLTPNSKEKSLDRYQHHFSSLRRLISSRKGTQESERSDRDLSRKFLIQERNDKRVPYEDDELEKFDDYGERTINRKSKNSNSNKDPSTNENDSHFDKIN